ncbi:unnamed protein product, partial [Strongylus vulgaris]
MVCKDLLWGRIQHRSTYTSSYINNESDEEEESEDSSSEDELEGKELDQLRQSASSANEPLSSAKSFSELGLSSWLIQQLSTMRIMKPTPVQACANCIPQVLKGQDVLGCAKTGTGKTLAFVLPILNEVGIFKCLCIKLAVDPYGIFALVLTPTRELASQIYDQFVALGKPIALK